MCQDGLSRIVCTDEVRGNEFPLEAQDQGPVWGGFFLPGLYMAALSLCPLCAYSGVGSIYTVALLPSFLPSLPSPPLSSPPLHSPPQFPKVASTGNTVFPKV